MSKLCFLHHCCCKCETNLYFQSRIWPLISVGSSCLIMKHYSNTWSFIVIPLQCTCLHAFNFSLLVDFCLPTLSKGICHIFYNYIPFSSLISGCIKIFHLKVICWNRSTFAKTSPLSMLFVGSHSIGIWDFLWIIKVFIKSFPYNTSNPKLNCTSQLFMFVALLLSFEGCGDLKVWL